MYMFIIVTYVVVVELVVLTSWYDLVTACCFHGWLFP